MRGFKLLDIYLLPGKFAVGWMWKDILIYAYYSCNNCILPANVKKLYTHTRA